MVSYVYIQEQFQFQKQNLVRELVPFSLMTFFAEETILLSMSVIIHCIEIGFHNCEHSEDAGVRCPGE